MMLSSAAILVLTVMAGVMQAESAEPALPAATPALTPQEFQRRVQAYGGAVGLVFEEAGSLKENPRSSSGRGRGVTRMFSSGSSISSFASSLVETKGANLLCAFSAGSTEDGNDTAIWIARYSEREGWDRYEQVCKISDLPHWNPVLFRDPKHAIYLFFKVGADASSWQTYWVQSEDAGRSWSDAIELVPGDRGGRGPVKTKPIILSDGAWLAPASTERGDRNQGAWQCFADRSDDTGKTWTRSENFAFDPAAVPGAGVLHPTFWQSAPNEVHALVRTSGGFIGRADSHDGGKVWTPVTPSSITNNNSPIDALRLDDGRVVLVYNPARKDAGPRSPLTVALSTDNGATWTNLAHLETEPGSFTSPCIVCTRDGLAISYTWKGERIRCWQIPLKVLDAP